MKKQVHIAGITIGEALVEGDDRLKLSGLPRPRRHAEILLESVLQIDRTELYLRAREGIASSEYHQYQKLLEYRESGEPVQYVAGWAPFYGRRFLVGDGVFIPRFDTEMLVERVLRRIELDRPNEKSVEILDLCCGCGVIGLSIAAENPNTRITLADISEASLEYSARNALALMVNDRVDIVKWDALSDPPDEWIGRFRYVVANPPYIQARDIVNLHPDVQHEPYTALTDGGDGLSFYRRWVDTVPVMLQPGGGIFVEIGDKMAKDVVRILGESFHEIDVLKDLNGLDRVVEGLL